jgi:hypothetical protein
MRGKGRVPSELVRKREQAALDLALKGLTEAQVAAEQAKQGWVKSPSKRSPEC